MDSATGSELRLEWLRSRAEQLRESSRNRYIAVLCGGPVFTQKMREANPLARKLCASMGARLACATRSALFDAGHAERLQNLLTAARSVGRRDPIRAGLAGGNEVTVAASVFRQEEAAFVRVRLAPVHGEPAGGKPGLRGRAARFRRWPPPA